MFRYLIAMGLFFAYLLPAPGNMQMAEDDVQPMIVGQMPTRQDKCCIACVLCCIAGPVLVGEAIGSYANKKVVQPVLVAYQQVSYHLGMTEDLSKSD